MLPEHVYCIWRIEWDETRSKSQPNWQRICIYKDDTWERRKETEVGWLRRTNVMLRISSGFLSSIPTQDSPHVQTNISPTVFSIFYILAKVVDSRFLCIPCIVLLYIIHYIFFHSSSQSQDSGILEFYDSIIFHKKYSFTQGYEAHTYSSSSSWKKIHRVV